MLRIGSAPKLDLSSPASNYASVPEQIIGQGGQGSVYYGMGTYGQDYWPVAVKEPFQALLPAADLLGWINSYLGANFDLDNINTINFLPIFWQILQKYHSVPNTNSIILSPFAEAIASYAAWHIVSHKFPNSQRVWPAERLMLETVIGDDGIAYLKPITIFPLLPSDSAELSTKVYELVLTSQYVHEVLFTMADYFEQSAELFSQLQLIHKYRIVHRDIKPGNIMSVNGRLVLMDFGIAALGKTSPDEVCGTPRFVSPDARQPGGYTGKSDQFSMFATLLDTLLLALNISDKAFLLRHSHQLNLYQILGNGAIEQREEFLPEVFDRIAEKLPLATAAEIEALREIFRIGLSVKSTARHEAPAKAIQLAARIIKRIAERSFAAQVRQTAVAPSQPAKPFTQLAATEA
jgi:serine/threonine protein kinase